jgi:hypothetical protein
MPVQARPAVVPSMPAMKIPIAANKEIERTRRIAAAPFGEGCKAENDFVARGKPCG